MDNIWPEIFMAESVVIVIGNLLTIAVLSNASSLKKRGNWLIINLAVADFLIGSLSEPLYIATLKGYSNLFTVYTPVDILLGMASVFGLTALALDRLFAISRPFQHRTVSDKAYVVSIVIIWITAGSISIVSCIVPTHRFVVFFYIVLPLLTISQILMILSYVIIWITATSKRPSLRRRAKVKRITNSGSKTKFAKSTSQYEEQPSGSVRGFSESKRDPLVFFDCKTGSIRDYHGSMSEDTGSVRDLQNCTSASACNIPGDPRDLKRNTNPSKQGNITSLGNLSDFKQIWKEDVNLCAQYNCTQGSSNDESGDVIKCTEMIKEWKASSRQPRFQTRESRRCEHSDRDNKLAMTLFIVTSISLLAWLPFEVMNIILSLCLSCRGQLYNIHVLSFTKFLHYANSLVNPVIYTFRIQEFRRAINTVLTCGRQRRKASFFKLSVRSS